MVDLMTEVNFEFENDEEEATAVVKKSRGMVSVNQGGLPTEGEQPLQRGRRGCCSSLLLHQTTEYRILYNKWKVAGGTRQNLKSNELGKFTKPCLA